MILKLIRDIHLPDGSMGTLYVDNRRCYTSEDKYSRLIPGRYKVSVTWSHRFNKYLPEIMDTPGGEGVRINGVDYSGTNGCLLVGRARTADGVAKCADTLGSLIAMIDSALETGEQVWMEVA